jgi:multicomponent Na+:H+ antiporter subunit F
MPDTPDVLTVAAAVAYGALSLALAVAVIRLIRGPGLPDRVVALDLMAYLAIGFIAVDTLVTREAVSLDAATTLALIAFLGTVAFARYVQQAANRDRR